MHRNESPRRHRRGYRTEKNLYSNRCTQLVCSSLLFQTNVGVATVGALSNALPRLLSPDGKKTPSHPKRWGRAASPKCGEPFVTPKLHFRIQSRTQTYERADSENDWPICLAVGGKHPELASVPCRGTSTAICPCVFSNASPAFAHIESNVSSTNQWRTGQSPLRGYADVVVFGAWTLHRNLPVCLFKHESVPSD